MEQEILKIEKAAEQEIEKVERDEVTILQKITSSPSVPTNGTTQIEEGQKLAEVPPDWKEFCDRLLSESRQLRAELKDDINKLHSNLEAKISAIPLLAHDALALVGNRSACEQPDLMMVPDRSSSNCSPLCWRGHLPEKLPPLAKPNSADLSSAASLANKLGPSV